MEYNYRVEIDWNKDMKEVTSVSTEFIKSILIDRDYDNKNMPTIYITLSISRNLADQIILYKQSSSIFFRLFKFKQNNEDFEEEYINDEFIYFISDDINYNKNVEFKDNEDIEKDDEYRELVIGMLNKSLLDINKLQYSTIFKDSTTSSMLLHLTSKLNLKNLIINKPISYKNSDIFIIPKLNSIAKIIDYIDNRYHTIYSTPYRFFMDFDRTYLLNSEGIGCPITNEFNVINIDIRDPASYGAVEQGMITDINNKSYYIYINANDTKMYNSNLLDKDFNILLGINDNTQIEVPLSSYNESTDIKKYHHMRIYNNNYGILDNYKKKLEMDCNLLYIYKSNIDCSIFTLNKQYNILNVSEYSKYNGNFLLTRKRELYVYENDKLKSSVMLYFKIP